MDTTPMRVEISRALWGRGANGGFLKSEIDGYQCFLGFIGKAVGLSDDEITGVVLLSEACDGMSREELDHPLLQPLIFLDDYDDRADPVVVAATLEWELTAINDNTYIDDATREQRLIERGRHAGYEFVFVD